MIAQPIKSAINSKYIQEVLNHPDFYFQHLLDVRDRYLSYEVSEDVVNAINDDYLKNSTEISYEEFVDLYNGKDEEFLKIVGELISYLDLNASGKKKWNKYKDNRVIAKAGVRQTHWVNHLLQLKKDSNHISPDSIKNALDYAASPKNNLTILSNNHRKLISEKLLKKKFSKQDFTNDLIEYFKEYNITLVNNMNYTYVLSLITYSDEVKEIWLESPDSNKMSDSDKLFYQFENYLKSKKYKKSSIGVYLNSIKTRIPKLYKKQYNTSFSSFKLSLEEIQKLIVITNKSYDGFFKGKATFKNFLIGLKETIKTSNMKKDNLFDSFRVYLEEHRSNEIASGTINAYVESAKTNIPKNWEEIHIDKFKHFNYEYFNLKRLLEATHFKGFTGQMSFSWFVNNLIEKYRPKTPLNQILYGPPGTGKTYKTKEIAVNIILGEKERSREEILKSYDELKKQNLISFVTFHQSMSYEDFVEGIKPLTNENQEVIYDVQKGIFKEICSRAKGVSGSRILNSSVNFPKVNYYKMSLGGKNRHQVHKWCIENNKIALGWGDNENYTEYIKINDWKTFRDKFTNEFSHLVENSRFHVQAMFAFQNMKIGDIVIASLGNHIIDAIGVIQGEYEYDENNQFGFHHLRSVNWLAKNMNASPEIFLDKEISQMSIYGLNKQDIKIEKFIEYFQNQNESNINQDYILIIDEINRGNISSIFGELITLIEEDKRAGNEEEVSVILPYSKDSFSVPKNLYLIGTMNTADRSVEALDTALRRRFSFTEMTPDIFVLENEHENKGIITSDSENIDLIRLLDTINKRIQLLINKDHKIGHSYFLNVLDYDDLVRVFKDKVIPLLEEYFFGDFGKIGLVLGAAFVQRKNIKNDIQFAKFPHDDIDVLLDKDIYCFTESISWNPKSFISIYDNSLSFEE